MTAINNEPNPPLWPDSVIVIRPQQHPQRLYDDPFAIYKCPNELQRLLEDRVQDSWDETNQTFTSQAHHFSSRRHVVMFTFQVGYYTQVIGLGRSMEDVRFINHSGPFVRALNRRDNSDGSCLDTFWRGCENFSTDNDLHWAVSQASPLRRVHVGGDLYLHDKAAYASGGHLANSIVEGTVRAGGQQQFLIRNVHLRRGATGGAWSMVYAGCTGQVPAHKAGTEHTPSITVIERPRARMEKPYICLQDDGIRFELRIPRAVHDEEQSAGTTADGKSNERVVDFDRVCVVRPTTDAAEQIQRALDEGKHVVLSPAVYQLKDSIKMRQPNQVLLGLGLATLVAPPTRGPCIHVAPGVHGVSVAGVMLEASKVKATGEHEVGCTSLLEWGDEDVHDPGCPNNPCGLFDVYCRVGGAASTGKRSDISVDCMVRIHSGHVIGDNLWLWRADHAELQEGENPNYPHISPYFWQTEHHEYRVQTGCQVNGNDVTIYGLAVEHANGHQAVWSGERGTVYFYQCELPYGVCQNFARQGFLGYVVRDSVAEHELFAPGIYSNFRNESVLVTTAMEYPVRKNVRVVHPFTVKLDNRGGIMSIANGKGEGATTKGYPKRLA